MVSLDFFLNGLAFWARGGNICLSFLGSPKTYNLELNQNNSLLLVICWTGLVIFWVLENPLRKEFDRLSPSGLVMLLVVSAVNLLAIFGNPDEPFADNRLTLRLSTLICPMRGCFLSILSDFWFDLCCEESSNCLLWLPSLVRLRELLFKWLVDVFLV